MNMKLRTLLVVKTISKVLFIYLKEDQNMNNTALGAENKKEQVNECRQYTVEDLFCCAYAPFFWQAIQIRYPEYATYNRELYALFGGAD